MRAAVKVLQSRYTAILCVDDNLYSRDKNRLKRHQSRHAERAKENPTETGGGLMGTRGSCADRRAGKLHHGTKNPPLINQGGTGVSLFLHPWHHIRGTMGSGGMEVLLRRLRSLK